MIRRVLVFGIPVLTIETDGDTDEAGDATAELHPTGFTVSSILPTRPYDEPED